MFNSYFNKPSGSTKCGDLWTSENPISFNSQSSRDLPEEMLEKAGDRDGRFIVVPNVL